MADSSGVTNNRVYLEDLSEGMVYESPELELRAAQIQAFAREFDPQPFHLDDVAARGTLFGGLAASGWHTAAVTMKLLVQSLPLAGGIIGAGGELAWPRPTRSGDVLRVVSTILSVVPSKSKPDRGIVTVQSETRNQHGDVCQRLVIRLVVFRRVG
ncbi:MaoC family dehydratase [Cupriavidus sp. IDO]|uniref:MaoC family dehydratase n=1 Tax=Cupriavidus sp. IDO TaxID=1539142 RepID=UPI0006909888|nr:MaoC family dehydratase [Cupriavidus sp. IDO]KWR84623.1 dehydratase [Cupriavidus sp. IDO]